MQVLRRLPSTCRWFSTALLPTVAPAPNHPSLDANISEQTTSLSEVAAKLSPQVFDQLSLSEQTKLLDLSIQNALRSQSSLALRQVTNAFEKLKSIGALKPHHSTSMLQVLAKHHLRDDFLRLLSDILEPYASYKGSLFRVTQLRPSSGLMHSSLVAALTLSPRGASDLIWCW